MPVTYTSAGLPAQWVWFIFQYVSFWLIYNTVETGADPGEDNGEEDETVAGDEGDKNDDGHDESDDHSNDNDDDGSDEDDDDEDDDDRSASVLADVSLAKTIGTFANFISLSWH